MACETCGHTMSAIGHGMHHCPRCGTLAGCRADGTAIVPALVGRCRRFREEALGGELGTSRVSLWRQLGIAEAIDLPEDR